jgi:hypothetical protein
MTFISGGAPASKGHQKRIVPRRLLQHLFSCSRDHFI